MSIQSLLIDKSIDKVIIIIYIFIIEVSIKKELNPSMNDIAKLGERVRILRVKKDLTQQELADCLAITKQAVSRIEKGHNKSISEKHLKAFSSIFHCTEDYLLGKSNDPKKSEDNQIMVVNKDTQWEVKQKLQKIAIHTPELIDTLVDCYKHLSYTDIQRLHKIMKIFLEKSN